MIDILFIVFPTVRTPLNSFSDEARLANSPFYDNAMHATQSSQRWPEDARNCYTIDDWLKHLRGKNTKLYLSVNVTCPDPVGVMPKWVDANQWPDALGTLMEKAHKVVLISTGRNAFIYDQLAAQKKTMESFGAVEKWFLHLNGLMAKIQRYSKKSIRLDSDFLSSERGIKHIEIFTGAKFRPLPRPHRPNAELMNEIATRPEQESNIAANRDPSKCRVLTILDSVMVSWEKYRGLQIQKVLGEHGITHDWTYNAPFMTLRDQIKLAECDLVINEIWSCPPETIRRLAIEFPKTKFVNLNHSSPSFMPPIPNPTQLSERMETLEKYDYLAEYLPNVYNGTVMDKERFFLNDSKVVTLMNPTMYQEFDLHRTPDPNLLSLSLICRFCPLKNLPAQIAAVMHVAKVRPVSLLLATSHNAGMGRFIRALQGAGVIVTPVEWGAWEDLMHLLGLYTDIGLQASLSESLNMIALEHMMLGKPVVGCNAIEFLPKSWQANPQNPAEMARIILDHADHLEERSFQAKVIAQNVRERNNHQFINGIKNLLSS